MKIKPFVLSLSLAFAFIACDSDYLELESNVLGNENFDFESAFFNVTSTSIALEAIQSDNLSVAPLGVYHNFGLQRVEAHYVTQLVLPGNPTFPLTVPENPDQQPEIILPEIKKVVLYVPFFSRNKGSATEPDYEVDSLYQSIVDINNKLNLEIYKNKYLLRDFDPSSNSGQAYYSNQYHAVYDALAGATPLNVGPNVPSTQNTDFIFSKEQVKWDIPKANEEDEQKEEKLSPGLFVEFKNDAISDFEDILNQFVEEQRHPTTSKVYNQNIFNTYFRGLFFKVAQHNENTQALSMLRFSEGYVRVYYKETNAAGTKSIKNLDFKLGGRSISLLNNTDLETPGFDETKHLLVKGSQGTLSKITINNQVINDIKNNLENNRWLINEVDLTLYVANSVMPQNTKAPYRLLLYDYDNNRMLADFTSDAITNNSVPERLRRVTFGGILGKVNNKDAYKFRITNHIRNILRNNAENVALGLVVVSNVTDASFKESKQNIDGNLVTNKNIPTSATTFPFSTVLYNPNDANGENKLQLKISYTKPKN